MNNITTLNQQKLQYLKSLTTIEDYDYDHNYVQFEEDYMCTISFDDFEIGDNLSEIIENSDYYSCCGDILDKDFMMCPTCYEHN
jgi:hypothetical protein